MDRARLRSLFAGNSSIARVGQLCLRAWSRFRWQRYALCCLAIILACGAYYRHLWPTYAAFSRTIDPSCGVEYCDFTLYYYKQAKRIVEDDTPVKKYFYSPTFALLLRPIGALPKASALRAWTWVQASSLILLVVASMLALRQFPPWTHVLVLALTLTSYPVLHNWKWGQANTSFMALVILSFVLAEFELFSLAALALALVVSSRYYPVIYAVGFVAHRRATTLAWLGLYVSLLLVAWPALVMGPEHAWHFYVSSADAMHHAATTWVVQISSSEYLPTTIQRLARKWHLKPYAGTRTSWVWFAYGLAACNLMAALWAATKRVPQRALWAFSLIALATPLLVPTSWMHYFVYLPLVQTFVAAQLSRLRGLWALKLAGYVLGWAPSVVLSSIFFFLRVNGVKAYAEYGYLLLANMLLLLWVHILLRVRWAQHAGTS